MEEALKKELGRLKKENEILHAVIESIPSSIYWKDADGIYLGRNNIALEKMIAQKFESESSEKNAIVGKSDYDIFPVKIADQFRNNDLDVMKSGNEKLLEESFVNSSGKTYHHLSVKKPLYSKDNIPIGTVGITLDVTELKIAQQKEQEALDKIKEEKLKTQSEIELRQATTIFAGSIAHDLRNFLSSILITTNLFERKLQYLNEEDKAFFDKNSIETFFSKIKTTIQEMEESIKVTLKSLQHLVSGSLNRDDFTTCYIENCIQEALNKYPFQPNETNLVQADYQSNFAFLSHPILFYRIFFNIIGNALQQIATNEKGKIIISTYSKKGGNYLSIKDTAGGMPENIREKIFDGFYTSKTSGTGIGLAFCQLTMKSLGGEISCNSVEGQYTEFQLFFPKIKLQRKKETRLYDNCKL